MDLKSLHHMMLRIRRVEERLATLVEAGEIGTPCHLYIGQEAIATGVCSALTAQDTVWGGHRSHGHYLAKGGEMRQLFAEIFGKATGCSGGRGGSMHIFAPEVGVLGTVPLVAATIPLGVGAALAAKIRGMSDVAVAFFGDGATEEGHFHESMNLAALYKLPILFVCENNLYASHMAILERRAKDNIVAVASAHGMPGEVLDGNDVTDVAAATRAAVDLARNGGGPTLLECRTYRWRGHVGPSWDMDVGVKRKDELSEWLPHDPIEKLAARLRAEGTPANWFAEIEQGVEVEVNDALEFALRSPYPTADDLEQNVFVQNE